MARTLAEVLDAYVPGSDDEARDLARLRVLAAAGDRAWARDEPVHATASAIVVHPATGRVLLRWHERMRAWLSVGGHGDPGEDAPLAVARREAEEETGLTDLVPWSPGTDGDGSDGDGSDGDGSDGDGSDGGGGDGGAEPPPVHLAVVDVPAGRGEPAHEHADVRFVLATGRPDEAVPEGPDAPLRWLAVDDATVAVGEDNLRVTLGRVARLLADATGG